MPYKVTCDGDLVILNEVSVLPTLSDAKTRIAFYAGIRLAEKFQQGQSLPRHRPTDKQWNNYQTEPDGSLRLTVLGMTFLIIPA